MSSTSLPTTSDLRHPIVVFTANRTPAAGSGFELTLVKYGDWWAKHEEGDLKWLNGAPCEAFNATRFYVRNHDQLPIGINHVILFGDRTYRVLYTRILDPERRKWLKITCREETKTLLQGNGGVPIFVDTATAPSPLTPTSTTPYW